MAKAQYIGVNNVARKVTKQYVGVDNVARQITKGYIGVNNVARQCFAGETPVGELEVGSSVYMNVDGVPTEFFVVHQGNPDESIYDSSCDGTWLLAKDLYIRKGMDTTETKQNFKDTPLHNYLNTDFMPLLDNGIQTKIKEVKIPYRHRSGTSTGVNKFGAEGMATKIFFLSLAEVGLNGIAEGVCLSYFSTEETTDANNLRVAYYENAASRWWLRTYRSSDMWSGCDEDGTLAALSSGGKEGVRPAFILPSEVLVDDKFKVITE